MSKRFNIKPVFLLSVGFFLLFWFGDVLIDRIFFSASLNEAFFAESRELYMRTTTASLLALLFLVVSAFTQRTRNVESALRHSDELSSIFFESTKHAIGIIRSDGLTISGANRIFLQSFAVSEHEAVGSSFAEIVARQGLPGNIVAQVRESAESGAAVTRDLTYPGKNGQMVYKEVSTFPIGSTQQGVERVLLIMRDVTVRKTAEALLQASEARYRAIFDSTGTAMATVLPDGTLRMVNKGFEALTGYSRDELEGKRPWTEFVHPRDLEATRAQKESQNGKHLQSMELRTVDRFGATRSVLGSWAEIAGTHELVLSLTDHSSQKQIEEALRDSQAALAVAQRLAHLGNWEWDLKTDNLSWSDEMYRIYGVEAEGFAPSHEWVLQAVHPEDRELVIKAVNDAIYNHKIYDIEYRILAPGDVTRTVSARGEVTYDANGTPLRMVGTNLDVTWRAEAEQALRSSEEKFSKAFRASPDSIVITRAEDGRYIDVNQAFEEVTGYSREEVLGRTSTELGLWADQDGRMVMLKLLNQFGHVRNLDVRFRVKSGEIRELLWSAEVIEYRGEACLIAISRDVTEQRHLEKELLESDARLYMKHEELKNLFHQMEGIRREWEETMDCISDMFILADQWGKIRRFNRAVETFSGKAHRDIVGRDWREFIEEQGLKRHLEAPGVDLLHNESGKWLVLKRYAFPHVEVDGSTREVIIINESTGTALHPDPQAVAMVGAGK